jgi:hypothetical protein
MIKTWLVGNVLRRWVYLCYSSTAVITSWLPGGARLMASVSTLLGAVPALMTGWLLIAAAKRMTFT